MGGFSSKNQPPPVILVPPLFDFPPMEARSRMMQSSYELLFGKLPRSWLFKNHFEQSGKLLSKIMLRPVDDTSVDFTATLQAPYGNNTGEGIKGDAVFRWQPQLDDTQSFMEMKISGLDNSFLFRSCAFYQKYGLGTFTILPFLKKHRSRPEDYGIIGARYGSRNLSVGITMSPIPSITFPTKAWMVGKMGHLTAGFQYEPVGENPIASLYDLKNWSFAIDYGMGKRGALYPSFDFSLECRNNREIITSFYEHLVVQRQVKNPFEDNNVVGITNYIDLGFEFHSSFTKSQEQHMQVAVSWQANRNILLKAKIGTFLSAAAMIIKCWWQPSVTFSISYAKNHCDGKRQFGFGIHFDNLQEASYETADPNYMMLIPTKEQIIEDALWNKRPLIRNEEPQNLPPSMKSLHSVSSDVL